MCRLGLPSGHAQQPPPPPHEGAERAAMFGVVLAGAVGPTSIAEWARVKEAFLLRVLHLPNGIPRKDVFRRVLDVAPDHLRLFRWMPRIWHLWCRDP